MPHDFTSWSTDYKTTAVHYALIHAAMSSLPPLEVLYRICGLVVAEFLDALIAGSLRYSPPATIANDDHEPLPYDDLALTAENPVVCLLQASSGIRQATLLVVSDALGIPLDDSGVGR